MLEVDIDDPTITEYNFTKSDMMAYSRYKFTVTASTSAGEGDICDCVKVICETPPGGIAFPFSSSCLHIDWKVKETCHFCQRPHIKFNQ